MRKFLQEPRTVIIIFLAVAILMISSAMVELQQSKLELYRLMEKQSHSLLESLLIASGNALEYNRSLENSFKERLLNNANLIKIIYEKGQISDEFLAEFAAKNNINRINIFSKNGRKLYSSHIATHQGYREKSDPQQTLQPIFSGLVDSLIIGIKPARFEQGYRYAVAIAAGANNAIVLNLDAQQILQQRKRTGFGALIREMISNPGIIFIALQDTTNILAASANVTQLDAIKDSEFLQKSYTDSVFQTRTTEFDSIEVFEAVHPFSINRKTVGVMRMGLSLDPLNDINERIYRRLIVITIVLVVIGGIVFTLIFFRQRLQILERQYHVVETYSSNIIRNVNDAIIVYDEESGIKIFNHEASRLFQFEESLVIGRKISEIFPQPVYNSLGKMPAGMQQINFTLNNTFKHLLVSKSEFRDASNIVNIILVIRDVTDQKRLEEQIQRNERIVAMGELASGVAHEIRNPLNTIGTIIQQLDRDFNTQENNEEYHDLSQLVYKEVLRINKTISQFLKFARPEPLQTEKFELSKFFHDMLQQYTELLKQNSIQLHLDIKWKGDVIWDKNQMQQVFMNLIQNSIDAIHSSGEITIQLKKPSKNNIDILFRDSGPGIPDEDKSKIFNLYYTTKAKGTGIGLSIVQRIVNEHQGTIQLIQSDSGTAFAINLPVSF